MYSSSPQLTSPLPTHNVDKTAPEVPFRNKHNNIYVV